MAEEEEAEQAEEGGAARAAAPPSGSRLNQFIVLAVVVLLGQAALAYVMITRFVIPKQQTALAEEEGEVVEDAEVEEREKIPVKVPLVFPLEGILVNPQDEAAIRFLNVEVSIQVDTEDALAELQAKDGIVGAKVRDLVFRTLNTMPYHQLDGADDRVRLRERIMQRINDSGLITAGQVTAVYFRQFILN